ncbi:MAG: hypothetical protein HYR56_18045 [Acidobacteria bacterium]|nr:hypothetical protein [Acidobacteriota bacterium]MBI3422488.1 hypothetical protein [Acidobacteriota bacterium]
MAVKKLSVDLMVVTQDQLRKINIGLSKNPLPDDTVEWKMTFKLEERKKTTDAFAEVVTLNVDIQVEHHAKAEATAKKGLDDAQTSKALIAADTAKANKEGKVSTKRAKSDAQAIISSRVTA